MFVRLKIALLYCARIIGTLNSYLLLSLVFFLVLVPLGVLFRLFGNPIADTSEGKTLWMDRPETYDLEKPF